MGIRGSGGHRLPRSTTSREAAKIPGARRRDKRTAGPRTRRLEPPSDACRTRYGMGVTVAAGGARLAAARLHHHDRREPLILRGRLERAPELLERRPRDLRLAVGGVPLPGDVGRDAHADRDRRPTRLPGEGDELAPATPRDRRRIEADDVATGEMMAHARRPGARPAPRASDRTGRRTPPAGSRRARQCAESWLGRTSSSPSPEAPPSRRARRYYAGTFPTSDVQCPQRVAATGIRNRQYGHSFSEGGGGASTSFRATASTSRL